jgi:hypothetical protein
MGEAKSQPEKVIAQAIQIALTLRDLSSSLSERTILFVEMRYLPLLLGRIPGESSHFDPEDWQGLKSRWKPGAEGRYYLDQMAKSNVRQAGGELAPC